MLCQDEVDDRGESVYGEKVHGDHRYDTHGHMGLDPSESFSDELAAEDHTTL